MVSEHGEGDITVKMVLSGEELEKFLGGMPAGTPVTVTQAPAKVAVEKASPSFMSIFKPLVALEAVKTGVKTLVQHSSIANAYLGAMGKMFGAAVDLLLLPFTPLLNMLMLAMGKLIQWLVTSGLLEKIHEGVLNVVNFLQEMGDNLRNIWNAIKEFNIADLAKGIGGSIKDVAKFAIEHPIEAAVLAGATALMARGAWRFLFGAPTARGGFGAGFMGAGAAARGLGGGSAIVGLGRAGMIGAGAAGLGYSMYQAATGGKVLGMGGIGGGLAGAGMAAAGGAMIGGTIGSVVPVIGTGIGAGAGAAIGAGGYGLMKLGEKLGWFGGGGGNDAENAQVALLQEQNQILRGMAGYGPTNIMQDVTIYGTQPELVADQVLEQGKAAGMSVAVE